MLTAEYDSAIAQRMQDQHRELAARWFERLLALVPVQAPDIFPSAALLDHIPELIVQISGYLRDPAEHAISANTAVLDKARELGDLRHVQRASLHQVLREYQILWVVLSTFVVEQTEGLGSEAPPGGVATLLQRLQGAVNVLSQATVETFVGLYTATIREQAQRLEEFTRLAAHEWRQPLSTLQVGLAVIRHPNVEADRSARMWEVVDRNLRQLIDVTQKLEAVTRLRDLGDTPLVQTISLTTVAQEAARQLRDMADAKSVELVVQDAMPEVTLDVGRLELVLLNLLSNGIKYADPRKEERRVEVTAAPSPDGGCRLAVRDNGVGIPEHALNTVFRRFTRAHVDRPDLSGVPGLGLGLAIVDDCVDALGATIAVESAEGLGTTFLVSLPATQG